MADGAEDPARGGHEEDAGTSKATQGGGAVPVEQRPQPTVTDPGRGRRVWVRVLLGIATALAVLSIFAVWANRQLLNPTNWARTSTELLRKQSIRRALSGYLLDQLYAHVDVEHELSLRLPGELKPLAGPLAGGLHNVAEQAAERALELHQVQQAWRNANHAADQALVTIVNGGGKRVAINGGAVVLDLRQIVADLSKRLGLPAAVAEKLPASAAKLKIVDSEQLGLVRTLAKALHAIALILTIVTALLYALAVYLALGNRRRTLMLVGGSLVVSGLFVLVGRAVGQGQLISAITSDASIEPAANDAFSVATGLLVQVASAAIIIGVPLIAGGWVAGPARLAVAFRRHSAPHLRDRPALAYWATAALLALVFIWGPIPATRNVWEMLLFTILAFLGTHVLRVQIAVEFPDAQPITWRESFDAGMRSLGARVRDVFARSSDEGGSTAAQLERLAALHASGALTDEEYAAAKHRVLASA